MRHDVRKFTTLLASTVGVMAFRSTLAGARTALLVMVFVAAACTDSGSAKSTVVSSSTAAPVSTTTATSSTTTTEPEPLSALSAWSGEKAMLTVPLDHEDLDGPTIEVPVTRAEATDPDNRIGVLLVNPGGPGFPASVLAMFAEQVFTPELRSRFDIIAIDPRGTFPDTAVNCFTDLGDLWSSVDYSPDAPGELEALDAAVQGWVDQCAEDHSDLISHVSTMDTVHDMAALVEALGEEQVSYLGFSYGTVLGSAFVTAYPELVRAAIFDGAYLAYQEPFEAIVDSSEAMEALLVRVFAECDADPDCPIASGAQEAFIRVAAQADVEPMVSNNLLPTVNEQGFAMVIRFSDVAYGGSADRLLEAVADADAGDYFKLQGMLGEAARFLEAGGSAMAINCMDYPYREAVPVPDDAVERLEEITPTLSAVFPTPEGFDPFSMPNECMRWSVGPDLLPQPLSGEGAGPVLVVTATEDPVTPMASAEKLAAELVNGTLLVVDSPVHGSYQVGGPSTARTCATEYMDRFLIDLEIPAEGTSCEEA